MNSILCIHTKAGEGRAAERSELLRRGLCRALDGEPVELLAAGSHDEIAEGCEALLRARPGPVLLVGGGGSGTARALIDGVLAVPGALERTQVAFLRLGSGNLLARALGVPEDAEVALGVIGRRARAGRSVPCAVMRCALTDVRGTRTVRHAASLVGLGELARVPADLERFKAGRGWHARVGRAVGIERRTGVDYCVSTARRLVRGLLWPSGLDRARVELGGTRRSVRLLAGAVMNFPVRELPLPAGVSIEEPRLTLHLLRGDGAVHRRLSTEGIGAGATLRLSFDDPAGGAVFLDEDTLEGQRVLELSVVTGLRAVPGPDYRTGRCETTEVTS